MAPTFSTSLSRPCSGIIAICGCMWTLSHCKLYQCVIQLLCFSLCHHPPHPRTLPVHPIMCTYPILMNSMKKSKTSENQLLFTCQVSCTKAKYYYVKWTRPTSSLRKSWFFKLNFQFSNAPNAGKCELGQFLLRQSQIVCQVHVSLDVNTRRRKNHKE